MTIKKFDTRSDVADNLIEFDCSGIYFSFLKCGEGLSANVMLPQENKNGWQACPDGLEYCSEVEIMVTGEGQCLSAKSRTLGGCGGKLKYLSTQKLDHKNGVLYRIEYVKNDQKLKVCLNYFFPDKNIGAVRRWVDIKNISTENVGTEYVASSALYHIGQGFGTNSSEDICIHLPYSSWSGEAQWVCMKLEQLGIINQDCGHYRARSLGSRASAEMMPMAIIEDKRNGISYFFHIEHSASWLWEIGNLYLTSQHGLYLLCGGGDEQSGHWWKNLKPCESFSSIPVGIGCCCGGFEKAIEILTKYRRVSCKQPHRLDDKLPVIFNDYMKCLWGNPTVQGELPKIVAASKMGCEYYVIDSGWYSKPQENWWSGVGY